MIFMKKNKSEHEQLAHDLAVICVMKDPAAITPRQIADSYKKNIRLMLNETDHGFDFTDDEEELVRPC